MYFTVQLLLSLLLIGHYNELLNQLFVLSKIKSVKSIKISKLLVKRLSGLHKEQSFLYLLYLLKTSQMKFTTI